MARVYLFCFILALTFILRQPCAAWPMPASLPGDWNLIGRVKIETNAASAVLQGGFAAERRAWGDAEMSFRARAREGTEEVQLWAGFRYRDRDSRYVFALRGGNDNDLYLARYAPNGQAKFLGFAPLDFKPTPGVWYRLRAMAIGKRLQLYLNDEKLPRINIVDSDAPWTNGGVCLGGGWLPAEFSDLKVKALTKEDGVAFLAIGDQCWSAPAIDKEALRRVQRAAYVPAKVGALSQERTEVLLDGNWLFMPDYQLPAGAMPVSADFDDLSWHVMPVPEFWTPGLSWLHGETGFPELKGVAVTKGVAESLTVQEERRVDGYTFDWRKTKAAWYRHHLELPRDMVLRHFILTFDAVAKVSEIWVNGKKVGAHTGLFGQVKCDVTDVVKPGDNVIAVHVTSEEKSAANASAKVEGVAVTVEVTSKMLNSLPHGMLQDDVGGIWQPVKLTVTPPVFVSDCFIEPGLHGAGINLDIQNTAAHSAKVTVEYSITSTPDGAVFYESHQQGPIELKPGASGALRLSTPRLAPKLWSPQEPNLYNLEVRLMERDRVIDRYIVRFGFRTFTTRGSKLLLNGKPYWLRGGNPFPNTLRPNDAALARRFMQIAREGNVRVTRSHIVPFTSTWLDAADEAGLAVSFEGTWPWLMLRGDPPGTNLLHIWKEEFLSLIREHRNHPSLILWTVNNEMKFENADAKDPALLKKKWLILDDMIKAMRREDPTRPIVADSSYMRKEAKKGFQTLVRPLRLDDGDIDDGHRYYGWYNETFFHLYGGRFGRDDHTPGRPFISQEMATGYPNNDDGHPTRFYLFKHQTPQAFVGDDAWENADPAIFLKRQAFLTKELAETFRRDDRDTMAGILHFAYFTWFKQPWSVDAIAPWPAYDGLKTALQPVLVSAELYGRHFYAGRTVRRRVCIVNDAENCARLPASRLTWEVADGSNVLARGSVNVDSVDYYKNRWVDVDFALPTNLPTPRVDGQLKLRLEANGKTLSENSYDIVIATTAWAGAGLEKKPAITIIDKFDSRPAEIEKLRALVARGGCVLLLHPGSFLAKLYPKKIKSWVAREGEIVTMHVPESPVFAGVEPLDLAWFERGPRRTPVACSGVYHLAPGATDTTALAWHCDIHGYLQKPSDLEKYVGTPLVEIHDGKGLLLGSELCYETGAQDPIAMRLFHNAINYLEQREP
jgi:beta-galactosidase